MQRLYEICYVMLTKDMIEEMANVQPHRSGLDVVVNICAGGKAKHYARVKVSNVRGTFDQNDNFSITLDDRTIVGKCKLSSQELTRVNHWITINKGVILKIWDNAPTTDTTDELNKLKKV